MSLFSFFRSQSTTSVPVPEEAPSSAPTRRTSSVAEAPSNASISGYQMRSDKEIIDSLNEAYFEDKKDASQVELKALPDSFDPDAIDTRIRECLRALEIINARLSDRVLANYNQFVQGMQKVQEVQSDLTLTGILITNSRRQLAKAEENLIRGGLTIVNKHRKKKKLEDMQGYLLQIHTFTKTESLVKEALKAQQYHEALSMCQDAMGKLNSPDYMQFLSLQELKKRLSELSNSIRDEMEQTLRAMCRSFDPAMYQDTLTAWMLLPSYHTISEDIQHYFADAVRIITRETMIAYIPHEHVGAANLQSMQFRDLCAHCPGDKFVQCLTQIYEKLCDLLYNHHIISRWHDEQEAKFGQKDDHPTETEDISSAEVKKRDLYDDIRKGLLRNRKNLWDRMQQQVSLCLSSTYLSFTTFKVEDFLQTLFISNRFIEIGEDFSNSNSPSLRSAIREKSLEYFDNFHKEHWNNIKLLMENDTWQRLPVPRGFSLSEIKELRQRPTTRVSLLLAPEDKTQRGASGAANGTQSGFASLALGNPFRAILADIHQRKVFFSGWGSESTADSAANEEEEVDEDEEDEPAEVRQEYIEEEGRHVEDAAKGFQLHASDSAPVLSSSSLNVAKTIGKYIQLMEILRPISFEIFLGLTQLFEFYMYSVLSIFVSPLDQQMLTEDATVPAGSECTGQRLAQKHELYLLQDKFPNLRIAMVRIRDFVYSIAQEISSPTADSGGRSPSHFAVHINSSIRLDQVSTLYALAERVVGTESVLFLLEALKKVKNRVTNLMPKSHLGYLNQFYRQMESVVWELRVFVYNRLSVMLVHMDPYVNAISSMRWDIKDLSSENTTYVDDLLSQFGEVGKHLTTVGGGAVPHSVQLMIMEQTIIHAMHQLVEGYSRVKKCTTEGRALMSIDLSAFQRGLEGVTAVRPIPQWQYVDLYIKAWYNPPEHLVPWIQEHTEYQVKHHIALFLSVAQNLKKKQKTDAIHEIETHYANLISQYRIPSAMTAAVASPPAPTSAYHME
eukprot:GILJ01008088.1.p1 GENE.GILJ01008088.1~~GILJ01008088.1.p1  ORF type:complete len:1012 (+),score=165.37 GILJ01008088.1:151-3186(+)